MARTCTRAPSKAPMQTDVGAGHDAHVAAPRDYYEILHVQPSADPDVVAAAFRALARKHHPDRGGATERMAELNEAWAVLRDPEGRARYDRSRASSWAASQRTVHADGPLAARRHRPASATVLDFGRYAGWPLDEIARRDPSFLEWLRRTPVGRRYGDEIEALLRGAQVA